MSDSNLSTAMPYTASVTPLRSALVAFMGASGPALVRLLRNLQAGGFQICGLAALPNAPQTTVLLVDLDGEAATADVALAAPADPLPVPGAGRLTTDILLKAGEVISARLHHAAPERQTIGLPSPAQDLPLSRLSPATGHAPPDRADADRIMQAAHKFSRREAEVIEKLMAGKPNKIIAFELGISEATIKVHMRNIMRKLGATNRTQAAQSCSSLRLSGCVF